MSGAFAAQESGEIFCPHCGAAVAEGDNRLMVLATEQLEGKGRLYLARPLSRSWDYAPEK